DPGSVAERVEQARPDPPGRRAPATLRATGVDGADLRGGRQRRDVRIVPSLAHLTRPNGAVRGTSRATGHGGDRTARALAGRPWTRTARRPRMPSTPARPSGDS